MKTNLKSLVLSATLIMSGLLCVFGDDQVKLGNDIIYFNGAEATSVGGEVVLTFKMGGSMRLPRNARARVLAVGGGGAGGTMGETVDRGAAGGGGGGGVRERTLVLADGDYEISVGEGGQRVDTIVQSWVGDDGDLTKLEFGGETIVAAPGGGGGGTVKLNGAGTHGGCGGGGSWYGSFFNGGTGTDGFGWSGGTPVDENVAGGGGGAADSLIQGRGGSDGTAGEGRVCNISGSNVVYGKGGRGGNRNDDEYEALDGVGYGCGGDGAVVGAGGRGSDGVLIVRISSFFDYKKVPMPEVEEKIFEDGKTFTVFNLATANPGIDSVEGTTSVTCHLVGTGDEKELQGVGNYTFTLRLKDEYRWDDGSEDGAEGAYTCYWHIKDPAVIQQASVQAKKTVSWVDGANAIITLEATATPEKKVKEPKVLMLGSMCGAHGLSSDVVNKALNAICEVGSVDYFFYNKTASQNNNPTPAFSGNMSKGKTRTGYVKDGSIKLEDKSGNHGTLYAFYAKLANLINDGTIDSYDYILFCFDRSQVATYFPGAHGDEGKVAKKMLEFYRDDKVIWLVDDNPLSDSKTGVTQFPWFPSPMCYVGGTGYNYWSTLGYYQYKWGGDTSKPYGFKAYKALMGMFAPDKYESIKSDAYDAMTTTSGASLTYNGVMNQAGTAIENQCGYANAANVVKLIEQVIVAKPMTLKLLDRVSVSADGLEIVSVDAAWKTNDVVHTCAPEEISVNDGQIDVKLDGILDPLTLRADVHIVDHGTFRSSVGATYNDRTGLWEKDPNDGPVSTELATDVGKIVAETKASTAVQWAFPAYGISCAIVHGEGEFVINGFITNECHVAEGYTPEVIFRGKAGYVLDYLAIDGVEVKTADADTYNHFFETIGCSHDIEVGFTNILDLAVEPVASAVTCEYDGKVHGCNVTPPTFVNGYDFEWYPVYSVTGKDGPYARDLGALDAGTTEVYVRIAIKGQKGYDETEDVVMDYWTGHAPVTVTKRAITVKVCDENQTSDIQVPKNTFAYVDLSDNLAEGDSMTPNFSVAYPTKVGDTAQINATMTIEDENGRDVSGNYVVTVQKGTYRYLGQGACAAKATDIVKLYDGAAVSPTVTVQNPVGVVDGSTSQETYSKPSDVSSQYGAKNVNVGTLNMHYLKNGSVKAKADLTNCKSNDVALLTAQRTTKHYSVKYSSNNGQTWASVMPTFVDAGSYAVKYKVEYSETVEKTISHELTMTGTKDGWSRTICFSNNKNDTTKTWTQTVTETNAYKSYEGTVTVLIKPRKITLTAASEDGVYDGTPLTNGGYTPSGDGFAAGEGLASVSMTAASTITNPGSVANVIDQTKVVPAAGTKLSNYAFTYVNGRLSITRNSLRVSANTITKDYDGKQCDPIVISVTDAKGNPPSGYTITYATNPWGPFTAAKPEAPTDAGEYNLYYIVDGGAGYGAVTNHTSVTINKLPITVTARSAEKVYDTEPLTAGADVTGTFAPGEGVDRVIMKESSTITMPGKVVNRVDEIVFKPNTKPGNYVVTKIDGTLKITRTLTFPVKDDGEFSWTMMPGSGAGNVIILVDGVTNSVAQVEGGRYAVHISEPSKGYGDPSVADTCEDHEIQFIFTEDDGEMFPTDVVWYPAADEDEILGVAVNIIPATKNLEEIKKEVVVYNDPYSGWLPVYGKDDEGNDCVVGLRTSDGAENPKGNEGTQTLTSHFQLVVNGTGEITFGRIEVPVKDDTDANPDLGALTITVDGKIYEIPPLADLDDRCSIVTNNGVVVISNLVLQLKSDEAANLSAESDHFVTLTWTRDASDPTSNTAAYIDGITWKTFGETNDGGTSWIQDKQVWIIDHEDKLDEGYIYLCFRPKLKVEEELDEWVDRSSKSGKIKVKYGSTPDNMENCQPVTATLSDKHKVTPVRIWVKVAMDQVDSKAAYWKIYIEGSTGTDSSGNPIGPISDGDSTETENTFGILEIDSKLQYTMISIPWTDYSFEGSATNAIPVEKFVKPQGLEDGDMIYSYVSDDTYAVWMLDQGEWIPQTSFKVDKNGKQSMKYVKGGADARIKRGGALWVVRNNPTNSNGTAKKFWVYGQTSEAPATTEIAGGTKEKPGFTMMGFPGVKAVKVNDINWGANPTVDDVITVPTAPNETPITLTWENNGGTRMWAQVTSVYDPKKRKGVRKLITDFEFEPGKAFWYTRRGEPFEVNWEGVGK